MSNYGYRTGTFSQWPLATTAGWLRRLGYDCLELCLEAPEVRPEALDEARCASLRRSLDEVGIGLASASYHADREPLTERAANQERAIRVTRWLGGDILVLNGEKSVDQPRQWAEHVERLRRLCAVADQEGVTIAIEPEPLLVVGSSDDMLALLAEVGTPRLAVNLDIGHAQVTDADVAASIRRLGSAIVHLHLEDIQGRVHKHLPFGAGDIDFAAIRAALADIGYAGPYVVDLFGQGIEPLAAAEQALAGLRRYFPQA